MADVPDVDFETRFCCGAHKGYDRLRWKLYRRVGSVICVLRSEVKVHLLGTVRRFALMNHGFRESRVADLTSRRVVNIARPGLDRAHCYYRNNSIPAAVIHRRNGGGIYWSNCLFNLRSVHVGRVSCWFRETLERALTPSCLRYYWNKYMEQFVGCNERGAGIIRIYSAVSPDKHLLGTTRAKFDSAAGARYSVIHRDTRRLACLLSPRKGLSPFTLRLHKCPRFESRA